MKFSINYFILTIIILALSSCQNNNKVDVPDYLLGKKIPDWNKIYPLLHVNAQEWDSDAGLRLAVMEVSSQIHPEKRLVSAFFVTQNKEFEYLYLQYLRDGSIKTEISTYNVPISNFDLINSNMWKLNSTDAWTLFLQNPDVVSFDSKFFDCATLILINKQFGSEEKKVIWQLAIDDCKQGDLTLFLLDANTGEFLGKETH